MEFSEVSSLFRPEANPESRDLSVLQGMAKLTTADPATDYDAYPDQTLNFVLLVGSVSASDTETSGRKHANRQAIFLPPIKIQFQFFHIGVSSGILNKL